MPSTRAASKHYAYPRIPIKYLHIPSYTCIYLHIHLNKGEGASIWLIYVRTRAPPCRAPYNTVIVKERKPPPIKRASPSKERRKSAGIYKEERRTARKNGGLARLMGGDFLFFYNNSVIWCSTRGRSGSNTRPGARCRRIKSCSQSFYLTRSGRSGSSSV